MEIDDRIPTLKGGPMSAGVTQLNLQNLSLELGGVVEPTCVSLKALSDHAEGLWVLLHARREFPGPADFFDHVSLVLDLSEPQTFRRLHKS